MYSTKTLAGSRIFDFNVKVSVNGTKYLIIKELQKGCKKGQIMIFHEHILDFLKGLGKALDYINNDAPKSYNIELIRHNHPKAYTKWLPEEDSNLKKLYKEGKSIKQLATIFQRKFGAIHSRLKKIEIYKR